MRRNRIEIERFLWKLNHFIENNKSILHEEDLLKLILPLKSWVPITFQPRTKTLFTTLAWLVNKTKKGIDNDEKKTNRTSNYIKRVAYGIDYQRIKWDSYEEIFRKVCSKSFKIEGLLLKWFYINYWEHFTIPRSYFIVNTDKIYDWDWEIIKKPNLKK